MDRSEPNYQTYFQTEYCPNDVIQEEDSDNDDVALRYQQQIINQPQLKLKYLNKQQF